MRNQLPDSWKVWRFFLISIGDVAKVQFWFLCGGIFIIPAHRDAAILVKRESEPQGIRNEAFLDAQSD